MLYHEHVISFSQDKLIKCQKKTLNSLASVTNKLSPVRIASGIFIHKHSLT